MKKKLTLFFVFGFAVLATSVKAEPLIEGLQGSGSEQDPVLIGSVSDLRTLSAFIMTGAMGNNPTKDSYFKMTSDITFESGDTIYDFDGDGTKESNFIPIGGRSAATTASDWHNFQGIFDGDGHIISGLRILYGNVNYVGLFGQSYGGSIYRVGIEDGLFSGKGSVGSLCGLATGANQYGFPGTTIKECFARNVDVVGTWWAVGGLVGATYTDDVIETVVENCYVLAEVFGTDFVGGFCGNNNGNSVIKNCYAFVFVESNGGTMGNYGGFAGQAKTDLENNNAIVNVINCYYNENWKVNDSVTTAGFALAGSAKSMSFMFDSTLVNSLNLGQTAIWQPYCGGETGSPSLYWECPTGNAIESDMAGAGTELGLKVYPNPVTNGELNVISKKGGEYSIVDFTGKTVKKGVIASGGSSGGDGSGCEAKINTKGLKSGVYILQVVGENAYGKTNKMACQRVKVVIR